MIDKLSYIYRPNPFLIVAGLGKPSFSHCNVPDTFSGRKSLYVGLNTRMNSLHNCEVSTKKVIYYYLYCFKVYAYTYL